MKMFARFWFWLAASSLAIWFLLIHAPVWLWRQDVARRQDPWLILHLCGAAGIYLVCVHNAMFTPSTPMPLAWLFAERTRAHTADKFTCRTAHVWFGRLGMILGVIGVTTGAYMIWVRQEGERTFGIGVTIGGALQLYAQLHGWKAIREYQRLDKILCDDSSPIAEEEMKEVVQAKEKAVQAHIGYMLGLFCCACGIPAAIRFSGDSVMRIVFAVGFLNLLAYGYGQTFLDKLDKTTSTGLTHTSDSTPLLTVQSNAEAEPR